VREARFDQFDQRAAEMVRWHVARARGEDRTPPPTDDLDLTDEQATLWMAACGAAIDSVALSPGAVERAVAAVERYYATAGVYDDFVFLWQMAVDVAVAYDDHDALARLGRLVDEHAGSRPGTGVRAHRSALGAELARRNGAPVTEVERHLRDAVEGYDRWGSPPYAARARARLGRLLIDTGRSEEGAALLAEADATFERLGAAAWRQDLVGLV
jgi:hypothetical protein